MKNKKIREQTIESSSDEKQSSADEEIEKLTQAVEEKAREAAEIQDRYLRTSADFDNYRKRMQRDTAEFRKYANEQMAHDLLPVLDHLELAIKHASESGADQKAVLEGVKLIHKQLTDALEKHGIQSFSSEHDQFDPARHDAAAREVTDEVPDNTVVQEFQKGYLYHDKVLRHAKVSVAKRPADEESADSGFSREQEGNFNENKNTSD